MRSEPHTRVIKCVTSRIRDKQGRPLQILTIGQNILCKAAFHMCVGLGPFQFYHVNGGFLSGALLYQVNLILPKGGYIFIFE